MTLSSRTFWAAVAVLVVGLFMLVAGIGPLWLPILVILAGAVGAVASKRSPGQHTTS